MNKYLVARNSIMQKLLEYSEVTSHHGMIGWVKAENEKPEYIYGEITGYFLSFCSYMGQRFPEIKNKLTAIMQNHVIWLQELAEKGFVTRQMLKEDNDWRNSAIFLFDISMIIRGLRDASLYVDTQKTLQLYKSLLEKFVDREKEILLPCIRIASDELPDKWSTRFDIHLMKAVANIICEYNKVDKDTKIINNIFLEVKNNMLEFDVKKLLEIDSHPLLYYIEGLGLSSEMNLSENSQKSVYIEKIMEVYRNLTSVCEKRILLNNPTDGTFCRSDVLSQFVRIGSVLKKKNLIDDWEFDYVRSVLDYTLDYFLIDGKVAFFEKTKKENYYNVWCAMFLCQALDFFIIASSDGACAIDIACDWRWVF